MAEETVTGPNGTTQEVPTSAVNGDGASGPPTVAGTGDGTNPVAVTQAPDLSPAQAKETYSTGLSGNIVSEHREQSGDLDEVKRLDGLMAVLKSLTDGTFRGTGANAQIIADLEGRAKLSPKDQSILNGLHPGFWRTVGNAIQGLSTDRSSLAAPGAQSISPAGIRALRGAAVQAIRTHMTHLGLDPQGATNYAQLQKVYGPDQQELARQAQDGRGQTQPLAPFERTNDLLTLLDDLETGKSTSNVNPEVYRAMVARAGEPTAFDPQPVGANASTSVDRQHLENIVSDAIRTHMQDMHMDPKDAYTAQQLKAVQPSSATLAQFQAEGYTLKNVTTFGSLASSVHQQSINGGSAIPGGVVSTSTPAQTSMNGAQIYSNFQQAWKANKDNFRNRATAALNAAGITDTTLTTEDYGAVASAFVTAMKQTKPGESVWATVDAGVNQNKGGVTYTNPGYAQVMAEANKIGTHLTDEEANHLAALYGNDSSTGDTAALDEAVASYYQFDPNEAPRPGSYAATAQQAIEDEYGKYGITLSNNQSGVMVQDLLKRGGTDLSSLYTAQDAGSTYAEARAKQVASALYPTLAPFISQGETLTGSGGIMAPYQSAYASMMGVDESTVDVTDPDFIKLIAQEEGTTTGAKGTQAAGPAVGQPAGQSANAAGGLKSLDQFQAAVMQSPKGIGGGPAWQNTENAEQAYAGMANYLVGSMGFSPTAGQSSPSPSAADQQGLS